LGAYRKISNSFLVPWFDILIFNTLLKTTNHLTRLNTTPLNYFAAAAFFYCEPGTGTFAHFPHPQSQTGVSSAVKCYLCGLILKATSDQETTNYKHKRDYESF
jgi:hypothetical protein